MEDIPETSPLMSDHKLTEFRAALEGMVGRIDAPLVSALGQLSKLQEGLSLTTWGPRDAWRQTMYQNLVNMKKELVGYRMITELIQKNLREAIVQREKELGLANNNLSGYADFSYGTVLLPEVPGTQGCGTESKNPGSNSPGNDKLPEGGERQESALGEAQPPEGRIQSTTEPPLDW